MRVTADNVFAAVATMITAMVIFMMNMDGYMHGHMDYLFNGHMDNFLNGYLFDNFFDDQLFDGHLFHNLLDDGHLLDMVMMDGVNFVWHVNGVMFTVRGGGKY